MVPELERRLVVIPIDPGQISKLYGQRPEIVDLSLDEALAAYSQEGWSVVSHTFERATFVGGLGAIASVLLERRTAGREG